MFRRRTRIARYPVLPSMRRTQRCVPGSKASRHLKRQGICGHRKLKLGRLWRPMPCLSCFHFCRAFKESIVLSPHTWLRQHRLEQAMNLLCDTGLSVVSVSQRRSAMPPKPCWRIQKRRRRFQKSQASRSRVKRTPLANATGDPATARTGDLRPTDDVVLRVIRVHHGKNLSCRSDVLGIDGAMGAWDHRAHDAGGAICSSRICQRLGYFRRR